MPIEVVPFRPDLLPALARFMERTWDRPRDPSYLEWRYLDCPTQIGYVALERGECLAVMWAFLRPYRIDGRRVAVADTYDWYTSPRLVGSGVGVRVIRAMMAREEPLVTMGGTEDTLRYLPRLGWREVAEVDYWTLPLGGGRVGGYLERRFRVPAALGRAVFVATAGRWFRPRRAPAPRSGAVAEATRLDPEILALYEGETGLGLVPLPDAEQIAWLLRCVPAMGRYQLLEFRVAGALRGWSLAHLPAQPGQEAVLVDLWTPPATADLLPWMLGETLTRMAAARPDSITTAAGNPALRSALRGARFMVRQRVPILAWSKALDVGPSQHHLLFNTGDFPLVPIPSSGQPC